MAAADQVQFNQVPGDLLVPLFAAELNAGPPAYTGNSPQILLGRALGASMAASPLNPINVGSKPASAVAGLGSIGAEMVRYARRRNPVGEMWFINVGNPSGGVQATGAFTIAGTATANGNLVRYIGGERYEIGVAAGDTAATVATAFTNKINQGYRKFDQRMGAPVIAAVDGAIAGKINLTARHTGVEGNWIDLDDGLDGDELEVAGLTVTETAMSGGVGEVDMAAVLAALGSLPFDWITSPYGTTAQLNAARDFLANRWSPLVGLQGHYITAFEGNLTAQTIFAAGRNDPFCTILSTYKFPQSRWCWIAALAGEIAFRKNLGRPLAQAIEIAKPMQTLVLEGLRPPKAKADCFGVADRQSLLKAGLATVIFRGDGQASIERVPTTYKTNGSNLPDPTFRDIESVAIAAYTIRYMRQVVQGTYPRHVMQEDNPGNIQGVVTPKEYRGTIIHAYTDLNRAGLVRQVDLFTRYLVVSFDYENDRANSYIPVSKAAALRVHAANVTLFLNMNDQNASGL